MRKGHRTFLGVDPTPNQTLIYEAFPKTRGVSCSTLDVEFFEATTILALVQSFTMKQVPDPHRVHFFVKPAHKKWAVEQLKVIAGTIFGRLRPRKDAKQLAPTVGKLFHAVLIGCRVLQVEVPPDRWVSFGYSVSDPIPDWMCQALLKINTCA